MIPPASDHLYFPWEIPSFLREVFVIETSIEFDIISERTLSKKCFTSCALSDLFCIDDTAKRFWKDFIYNIFNA